jgi:hypothetical protein
MVGRKDSARPEEAQTEGEVTRRKKTKPVECNAACTSRLVGERCAYNPGMTCPANPLEDAGRRAERRAQKRRDG